MFGTNKKTNVQLFALIIVSAVIPTIIVGLLTLQISEQSLRNETEVKLSVANTTARKQLVDWVTANKAEISYLSTGIPSITQDIETIVQDQNPITAAPEKNLVAQDLKRFLNSHTAFYEIFLLQPTTGQVLVSTSPGQEGKLHADQPYFIQGRIHPFVQNVYYSISVQQQTITISAPVRDAKGLLVGVLAGQLNLDQLNAVLQQPSGLGKTVKSYAVNTFKLIVAGLANKNELNQNYSYHQLNTLPVTEGLSGKSGVATYNSFNGVRVVGSYLPIPELDLLVVTEINEDEILKPIQSLWFITYLTTGVTLGITVLVATYLARLFLTSTESYRKKLEIANSQLTQTQKNLEAQNVHLGMLSHSLEVDKEHMEHLLHSLSEGVLALDQARNIWLCNAAAEKILGVDRKQLVGKNIDAVFKVTKDHSQILFDAYYQANTATNFELDSNTENQEEKKTISILTAPIVVGTSGQSGWAITFTDVTKESQLESMKLDFVSMAAHELRTPLTSLRGYSALLKDELSETGSADVKEYINRLVISSNNLGGLIDNLLNVSRIEQNTFKIETVPIDLAKVVSDTILALGQQAKSKQQTLTYSPPTEPMPLVNADVFRISQVVTNLIANAITYTPVGGSITIDIKKKNDVIEVSVSDTGEGIPQDALPKLFTKFFRVSGVLEQRSKGTGLGLYITKSIITLHKGEIWVESTVGKGSTFHFTLPIASDEDIKNYAITQQTHSVSHTGNRGVMFNPAKFVNRMQKHT